MKSFLFGEDLVHWKIEYDAESPSICNEDELFDDWFRVSLPDGLYMYHDATQYCPEKFNELATRLSGMQVFGTAYFITQTDFLSRCQHAPALPDKFRLQRPTYPCTQ